MVRGLLFRGLCSIFIMLLAVLPMSSVLMQADAKFGAAGGKSCGALKKALVTAKDEYMIAAQKLSDAKQKYKELRCRNGEAELKAAAKDYMLKAIDYLITELQLARPYVERAERAGILPSGETGRLDGCLSQLQQKKTEVESANTKKELKSLAKSIKKDWESVHVRAEYDTALILLNQTGIVLREMQQFSASFESELNALENAGEDVSELRDLLDEFNYWLEQAGESYDAGAAKFARADKKDLKALQTVNKELRRAIAHLKNARAVLKQMLRAALARGWSGRGEIPES